MAPPGLMVRRPPWVGPALLLGFVTVTLSVHPFLSRLTYWYGRLIATLAALHSLALPRQASITVRPLTIVLLVLVGAFAAGSLRARLRVILTSLAIYIPFMLGIDLFLATASRQGGAPSPFVVRGNIFDGLAGILAIGLAFFWTARLPGDARVTRAVSRSKHHVLVLALSLLATAVSLDLLVRFEARALHVLTTLPLLGGTLSGVVLFFALFPAYLCLFGFLAALVVPARRGQAVALRAVRPTFAFLVPAHNETGRIGACIDAIDECAAESGMRPSLYVVENGSTDGTYEEARIALASCRHLQGILLTSAVEEKARAKAHALNTGLAAASEDVIIRVDADTFVSRNLLTLVARHFRNPIVGGVGTLPLPHKVTTWIERMRVIEVYYGAGFKRTSQGAADAIPVLPGATVAFRRDLLMSVGGFSEGILGEDSDITVRVGRLGYQIVSDPAIKVFSEQPQNFRELREQRMRWAGGLVHMIGRNRSTIYRLQGLRGIWTLPWACFVMFRKLMLIPFALAALVLMVLGHSLFPLREVAAAGAITLGVQLVVMFVVLALLAGPVTVVYLPGYIVFRLIVTYFALETLLGVRLKETRGGGRLGLVPRRGWHRRRGSGLPWRPRPVGWTRAAVPRVGRDGL